jgi:hypothetical protein
MFSIHKVWTGLLPVLLLGLGCAKHGPEANPPNANQMIVDSEPSGAKGVLEVRKQAKDGDEVVVTGRVGGSTSPIIAGALVFTIVDPSLKPCNEKADDSCATPWDYCCDPKDKLAQATASIKVVDAQGNTVEKDARQFLGIKELQTVVVRGKAKRDANGNLTVLADQVYVKK